MTCCTPPRFVITLTVPLALWLQGVGSAQETVLSFDEIKDSSERRAASNIEFVAQVKEAVRAAQASPDAEKLAKLRFDQLESLINWQVASAAGDKRVEEVRRQVMEKAEKAYQKKLAETAEFERLTRLQRLQLGRDDDFAKTHERLTRLTNIPSALEAIRLRINGLQEAVVRLEKRIGTLTDENRKINDLEAKARNDERIKIAKSERENAQNDIRKLESAVARLERYSLSITGVENIDAAVKELNRRRAEIDDILKSSERQLLETQTLLDAFTHIQRQPNLRTIRGSAVIRRSDGTIRNAREVHALKRGDIVRTGKNSRVYVVLETGASIRLGSLTEFHFQEQTTRETGLVEGVMWMQSSLKDAFRFSQAWSRKAFSRRFCVRTPNVAVGVRSTEYLMWLDPDGGTHVLLRSGELKLTLNNGKTERLTSGTHWFIAKDATAGESQPLREKEFFKEVDRLYR